MKIYQILQNFYLGEILEYPDEETGIPFGYTRKEPPELPESGGYIKWNGIDWEINSEPPPSIPLPPKVVSKLEFLDLLSDDTYVNILTASKTDIVMEAWINKFNLISSIDLNESANRAWIKKLVDKNLLTQEQFDTIIQD